MEHEDFLIEPVATEVPSLEKGMPHRIYRRHLADGQDSGYNSCGVKGRTTSTFPPFLTSIYAQLLLHIGLFGQLNSYFTSVDVKLGKC